MTGSRQHETGGVRRGRAENVDTGKERPEAGIVSACCGQVPRLLCAMFELCTSRTSSYKLPTTHYPLLICFFGILYSRGRLRTSSNDVPNTLTLPAQWRAGTASTTMIHPSQSNRSNLLVTASRSLFVSCNRTCTSSHDPASTDQWGAGAAHTAVTKSSSGTWRDAPLIARLLAFSPRSSTP